jgi:hypothetical protein
MPTRVRVPSALWTGALMILVIVGSLCEPQSSIPSVYTRHFGRGITRRLAGWVLAPGWAAGVFFAAVATVGTAFALQAVHKELRSLDVIVATLAQLLLPLLLVPYVTFPRLRPAAWYLIVQIASFGLGSLAPFGDGIEAPLLAGAAAWLLPLCPTLALAMESDQPDLTPPAVDALSVAVALTAIAVAAVRAAWALGRAERLVRHRTRDEVRPAEPARDDGEPPIERVANL